MNQAIETNNPSQSKKLKSRFKTAQNVPKLILLVSLMSFSTFSCGFLIAYIVALGLKNVQIVYGQTAIIPVVRGFLIASLPFGISFGSFIGPSVIARATRKNLTLILSFLVLILYGIIQIPNLVVFYVVRFLQGVLIGIFLILIPLYIKQITPKQISTKSLFGVFEKLFLLFGFVVPFGLNVIMLKTELDQFIRWRIIITANAVSSIVVIILILTGFIPQSPISLIEQEKVQEAKQVIRMFHKQRFVGEIFAAKVKQVEVIQKIQKHIGHPHLQRNICKLKTFLTFEVPIVHQLTGVNAYISQMGLVISTYNEGFSDYIPFLMTSVQLLTLMSSLIYISKITPRKIILIGNGGMSLCCFGIGTGLILVKSIYGFFWMTVVFIILFMGLNGGTFIPAAGIYVSQVGIRRHVRWSLICNWFASAASIVLFVTISAHVGYAAVFYGFGVITLIGFLLNLRWMVETRLDMKCQHIQLRTKKKVQRIKIQDQKKREGSQTDRKPETSNNLTTHHTLKTMQTL